MLFDRSQKKICTKCAGKGEDSKSHSCPACNGTGKYTDEYYVIEANGIAFDSDFAGK